MQGAGEDGADGGPAELVAFDGAVTTVDRMNPVDGTPYPCEALLYNNQLRFYTILPIII